MKERFKSVNLEIMKKFIVTIPLALFLLIISTSSIRAASLLTIKNTGEVVLNVLSYQDGLALAVPETDELEVRQEVSDEEGQELVSLNKDGDKFTLSIGEGGERKTFDISSWSEDLVEIEEREDNEKINISLESGKFAIEQGGFIAYTDYPINIDPEENRISLETSSGSVFLAIFPVDAAQTVLRSKLITIAKDAFLSEKDTGTLTYQINGEKEINLFNITSYSVPVTTQVSASTGEIISVDQPVWLKIYNLLLG